MNHQTKTKFIHSFILMVLSLITVYFALHVAIGDRGWLILAQNKKNHLESLMKLEILSKKKADLEKQIHGLKEETIDLDLLEEKARFILGYIKPNEKIILDPYKK